MSLSRWIALRQARDALAAGRLDEARRRLEPWLRTEHRGAIAVGRRIAAAHRMNAEKALRRDHPEAAWKELLKAEGLPHAAGELDALRATLTKLGAAECRAALAAGRAAFVLERLATLRARRAAHPEFDPLEDAALAAQKAAKRADRGEFDPALAAVPAGRAREAVTRRAAGFADALPRMASAVAARDWPAVLEHSSAVLGVAPHHAEARAAKARAWEALQTVELEIAEPAPALARPVTLHSGGLPRRFLLWIDGVGGYLVCTGARVAFGQATPAGPVDVPLFADVSRLHAEIHRDGEGYVLESARGAMVNGAAAPRAALAPGDRVTLGATCQLLFAQPMGISATAKLELVSGHRLPIAVDAVWLMADNLVMGRAAHIEVPELKEPAVLFRSKDGLGFRCAGRFRIDGEPREGKAVLPFPCHVAADGLSFAVEPVG